MSVSEVKETELGTVERPLPPDVPPEIGLPRAILEGSTHDGHKIEAHATELAAGAMPHPPHRHKHEEMFLLREGTVEVTVNGKSTRLGPGGIAFIASDDEHGIKNAGSTPAQYFVIALGHD